MVKIKVINKEIWAIIDTYGENENEKNEIKDEYFRKLQETIDNERENLITMGDFNGRLGNENKGLQKIMESEEVIRNINGERMIQLCVENDDNYKHEIKTQEHPQIYKSRTQ